MFQIQNEFSGANIPRTMRFTEGLFDRLNCVAQQNGISFNLLVLQCCKFTLDSMEQQGLEKGWGRAKAGELEFYFLKEDGEEPSSFFAEWEPKPSAASGGKREAKVLGFAR